MKKRIIVGLIAASLVFTACSGKKKLVQHSLEKGISFNLNEIGVVNDNRIQFYSLTIFGNWVELTEAAFALPQNCTDVIGDGSGGLIAIVGDHVKYYYYNDAGKIWEESPGREFKLPKKYQGILDFNGSLGVIINNKVKFFWYNSDAWEENKKMEFAVPKNAKGLFGYYQSLGLIVDNELQFHYYNQEKESWEESIDARCILPEDYTDVFTYNYEWLGISSIDKISFYYRFENGWGTIDEFAK